jgi:hypothetical protein
MAVVVGITACGDAGTGPDPDPEVLTVQLLSGDGQRGLEQEPLPGLIRVAVVNDAGLRRSGVTVQLEVVAGGGSVNGGSVNGGSVNGGSVRTDNLGEAEVRWRLGPAGAGDQRLTLRAGSGSPGEGVTVTATAVRAADSDVLIVHGAVGPLRGLLALRDTGQAFVVVQERLSGDTVLHLQPQDAPGLEVVVFPTGNRPLWDTHAWTPGPDTLHVTLQPPVAVDMVFHVRVGDFEEQTAAIDAQLERTTEVWQGRHMGVVVGEVAILDEITDGTDANVSSAGLCGSVQPTNAIEVIYVTSIDGGQYDGWGCTSGLIHMSLHSRAHPYLLAHELGHTFALGHTDAGLMYGPSPGTRVWDGEILRAHFHGASALNTLFAGQLVERRDYCAFGRPCFSADYLLGQEFGIAAPASLIAAARLHDGLRRGGRPLDGVEEELVRPPRLPPELRPESEQHHVP